MSNLFANYKRLPVSFRSGLGCTLVDHQGTEYLDFLSGIAVSSLGHSHPSLVEALTEQVSRLLHVSNLYEIPEQELAAGKLVEFCGQGVLNKVFFCNSGAEANECLLKLARRYAQAHSLPPTLTVTHNGFHGRTLATVSATGTPKYHEGFQPLLSGFQFVDYNDLDGALAALQDSCGILIEPVQGEGGVIPAQVDFLRGLEAECKSQGKLLLLDEVQTGIGRTGEWLAAHNYGVQPDAVSLAKGLGAGIPVGAVLAKESLSELLGPGSHGTTFGGNPLASCAVSTVLETMDKEGLLQNAKEMGAYFSQGLRNLDGVEEVRGLGLLMAAVTRRPADQVAQFCFEDKLLVNAVRPHVIRFAPPLVVSREEIDRALAILQDALCL